MQFKIVQSGGEDGIEWTNLIQNLGPKDQDIFFLPEYLNIYQQTYGYIPFLAFYGDDRHYIIQVFVKRPLNELPFLKEQKITEPFYDIANPYGYGGPVCRCHSIDEGRQLFNEFNLYFCDYCFQNKIASEFTCCHPLLENHRYVDGIGIGAVEFEKEIVFLDLTKNEETLWSELRSGHKYSIKKAIKANLRVEKVSRCLENFEIFKNLYYQTMLKDKAVSKWFFPDDYFWNHVLYLGSERVSLFFAFLNELPISASMLIHDFSTLYYHFSATDINYYSLSPNTLLLWEVILWAKRNGFHKFHLGGGVSSLPEDNLLKFKSGFSKQRARLYSYHRIHNPEVYDFLCSLKKRYEMMSGEINSSDYFPRYRS